VEAVSKEIPKDYIGDGIYIEDIGFAVRLTTEDGVSIHNEILFGPQEFEAIQRYMKRVEENTNG
jgi:hypothetical protein